MNVICNNDNNNKTSYNHQKSINKFEIVLSIVILNNNFFRQATRRSENACILNRFEYILT